MYSLLFFYMNNVSFYLRQELYILLSVTELTYPITLYKINVWSCFVQKYRIILSYTGIMYSFKRYNNGFSDRPPYRNNIFCFLLFYARNCEFLWVTGKQRIHLTVLGTKNHIFPQTASFFGNILSLLYRKRRTTKKKTYPANCVTRVFRILHSFSRRNKRSS